MRCHTIIDQGKRIEIPGCMGAAVYGKRGCTCPKRTKADEIQELRKRIEAIENRLNNEGNHNA